MRGVGSGSALFVAQCDIESGSAVVNVDAASAVEVERGLECRSDRVTVRLAENDLAHSLRTDSCDEGDAVVSQIELSDVEALTCMENVG